MREMKDSGIEWIGEIPVSWASPRMKFYTEIDSGEMISKEEFDENGEFPVVGSNGEIGRTYKNNNQNSVITTGRVGTVGTVQIVENAWITDNALIIKPKINIGFLKYVIPNFDFDMMLSGTAQPLITATKLKNQGMPLPSEQEQTRIADYLDKKCAEIDAIIAAKEKTNELLKERRQSIIYEAVTKGLDPTVPMKDSGIEWIGEIPKSWDVWRLKHLLRQEKGSIKAGPFGSSITANDMQGHDVKVFTQRTVLDNDFVSGEEYISTDKYEELKGFSVQSGDILITTRGTIGKTAIVPENSFGILHPCLIKMSIDSEKMNKSLLCRVFNETNIFQEQLRLASNATTIDVIYTQNLMNMFVPLAPLKEQDAINAYLDDKCSHFDKLISSNKSTIEKLKEYRQSVIYEAVTGKVEI